jgi:hypothetical protein
LFSIRSTPAKSAGTGWLPLAHRLHYLSASRQVEDKQILEERSNPMKVKTNTKAGSALWGS